MKQLSPPPANAGKVEIISPSGEVIPDCTIYNPDMLKSAHNSFKLFLLCVPPFFSITYYLLFHEKMGTLESIGLGIVKGVGCTVAGHLAAYATSKASSYEPGWRTKLSYRHIVGGVTGLLAVDYLPRPHIHGWVEGARHVAQAAVHHIRP